MKILLIGSGKISKIISEMYNDLVVGVVDQENEMILETPTVIIDFSHPNLLDRTIHFSNKYNIPIVIGTTGYNEEKMAQIKELSKNVAVLLKVNFSNGITLIKKILNENIQPLKVYKRAIIERHDINKKDSPSGTAIALAELINTKDIFSFRSPAYIAEHDIVFENDDEVITIKHKVLNREVFAIGAVTSAKWLLEQKAGLYT